MILCMVHSLTPFEILEPANYQNYYKKYFGGDNDDIKIESRTDLSNLKNGYCNLKGLCYYMTNCNKIWNQMYFHLFASLFGSYKTTRYQHMLCYTSELYCHIAYIFKSTPRAMYGTDAGEHMNDKVKVLVHRISNKFVNYLNPDLPPKTIDMIMNYILYEYYHVRETNEKLDTAATQKKLKEEQQRKDIKTIRRPIKIINYFQKNKIKYKLNYKQFDDITKMYCSDNVIEMEDENSDDDDDDDHKDKFEQEEEAKEEVVVDEFKMNLESHLDVIENFIQHQIQVEQEIKGFVYIYIYIYI